MTNPLRRGPRGWVACKSVGQCLPIVNRQGDVGKCVLMTVTGPGVLDCERQEQVDSASDLSAAVRTQRLGCVRAVGQCLLMVEGRGVWKCVLMTVTGPGVLDCERQEQVGSTSDLSAAVRTQRLGCRRAVGQCLLIVKVGVGEVERLRAWERAAVEGEQHLA
jgi:uncharacterized membrane protein